MRLRGERKAVHIVGSGMPPTPGERIHAKACVRSSRRGRSSSWRSAHPLSRRSTASSVIKEASRFARHCAAYGAHSETRRLKDRLPLRDRYRQNAPQGPTLASPAGRPWGWAVAPPDSTPLVAALRPTARKSLPPGQLMCRRAGLAEHRCAAVAPLRRNAGRSPLESKHKCDTVRAKTSADGNLLSYAIERAQERHRSTLGLPPRLIRPR
jgi:hypothetical protein